MIRCSSCPRSWPRASRSAGSGRKRTLGVRVAADLALAWGLVTASIFALGRARRRRPRFRLAAAAFALLAADLLWARSHGWWTLGFLLEGLWVALLVQLRADISRGPSLATAGGP